LTPGCYLRIYTAYYPKVDIQDIWYFAGLPIYITLIAFAVFLAEVSLFSTWYDREIVIKTILLRFAIYFLSGIAIGFLSQTERNTQKKVVHRFCWGKPSAISLYKLVPYDGNTKKSHYKR